MSLAVLLAAAYLLLGVDLEPVFSEHEISSFPVPFIKQRPSLSFVFSLPVEPYWIMYADPNLPPDKRRALQKYCGIRFGEGEKACLATLEKRLKDSGFYKAE
jgi:hypothetical protein